MIITHCNNLDFWWILSSCAVCTSEAQTNQRSFYAQADVSGCKCYTGKTYCYISWPGLNQFSSSSRHSLQAHVVYCTLHIKVYNIQQILFRPSSYIKRISTDQVCYWEISLKKWNFKFDMHWYIMQSLVKCLLKMLTVCLGTSGEVGVQWLFFIIVWSVINLILFPFDRHQTAFAFIWSFCKVSRPFSVWVWSLFIHVSFLDMLVLLQLHVQKTNQE